MASPTPSNSPHQRHFNDSPTSPGRYLVHPVTVNFLIPPPVQARIRYLEENCTALNRNSRINQSRITELEYKRDYYYERVKKLEAELDELKHKATPQFYTEFREYELKHLRKELSDEKQAHKETMEINNLLRRQNMLLGEQISLYRAKDYPQGDPFPTYYNPYGNIGE